MGCSDIQLPSVECLLDNIPLINSSITLLYKFINKENIPSHMIFL